MTDLETALINALTAALGESNSSLLAELSDSSNIFDNVDSFSIVNVLLESESAIEELKGEYLSLADETLFDASHSPLLKWSDWVEHVTNICNQ